MRRRTKREAATVLVTAFDCLVSKDTSDVALPSDKKIAFEMVNEVRADRYLDAPSRMATATATA
jgi:hypothetical protein